MYSKQLGQGGKHLDVGDLFVSTLENGVVRDRLRTTASRHPIRSRKHDGERVYVMILCVVGDLTQIDAAGWVSSATRYGRNAVACAYLTSCI